MRGPERIRAAVDTAVIAGLCLELARLTGSTGTAITSVKPRITLAVQLRVVAQRVARGVAGTRLTLRGRRVRRVCSPSAGFTHDIVGNSVFERAGSTRLTRADCSIVASVALAACCCEGSWCRLTVCGAVYTHWGCVCQGPVCVGRTPYARNVLVSATWHVGPELARRTGCTR